MPAAIAPDIVRRIPALAAEGMTISAMARRLGISRQTIRRVLAAAAMLGGTSAMAGPSGCHPSRVPPAWAMGPGDHVLTSMKTSAMTGVVSGWLAAHRPPALAADDYQIVIGEGRLLVVSVRAGLVWPGEAMVQLTPDVAADIVAAMTAHARSRA